MSVLAEQPFPEIIPFGINIPKWGRNTKGWSKNPCGGHVMSSVEFKYSFLGCCVRALHNSDGNRGSECLHILKVGCVWGVEPWLSLCDVQFSLLSLWSCNSEAWKADTEGRWCIPECLFCHEQTKSYKMLLKAVLISRSIFMHMQNDSQSLQLLLIVLKALSCETMLRIDHRCITQST